MPEEGAERQCVQGGGCVTPKAARPRSEQGHILDMVSLRSRPAEAEDRSILAVGRESLPKQATRMVTLVEHHQPLRCSSSFQGRHDDCGCRARKHIRKLPEQLRRSLTWDQGKEMSGHKRFTVATNVQVYFCDPRSPWQRGSNENTNGLLRQYFPRGTDLSRFSQAYLNGIALRLNQRPRKTLAFETPANRLQLVLH